MSAGQKKVLTGWAFGAPGIAQADSAAVADLIHRLRIPNALTVPGAGSQATQPGHCTVLHPTLASYPTALSSCSGSPSTGRSLTSQIRLRSTYDHLLVLLVRCALV